MQQSLRAALARGEPLSIRWIARLAEGAGLLLLAAILASLPLEALQPPIKPHIADGMLWGAL